MLTIFAGLAPHLIKTRKVMQSLFLWSEERYFKEPLLIYLYTLQYGLSESCHHLETISSQGNRRFQDLLRQPLYFLGNFSHPSLSFAQLYRVLPNSVKSVEFVGDWEGGEQISTHFHHTSPKICSGVPSGQLLKSAGSILRSSSL